MEFPIIHQDTQVEDVLNELVDESFICIGNAGDEFVGIVTRKRCFEGPTSWYMNSPMNMILWKNK